MKTIPVKDLSDEALRAEVIALNELPYTKFTPELDQRRDAVIDEFEKRGLSFA